MDNFGFQFQRENKEDQGGRCSLISRRKVKSVIILDTDTDIIATFDAEYTCIFIKCMSWLRLFWVFDWLFLGV